MGIWGMGDPIYVTRDNMFRGPPYPLRNMLSRVTPYRGTDLPDTLYTPIRHTGRYPSCTSTIYGTPVGGRCRMGPTRHAIPSLQHLLSSQDNRLVLRPSCLVGIHPYGLCYVLPPIGGVGDPFQFPYQHVTHMDEPPTQSPPPL